MADTSVLYAFLFEDDAHHERARAALASSEPVLVPAEILAETMLLAERRAGFEAARAGGAALRGLPHLEVQPTWDDPRDDLLGHAWLTFHSGRGKLSYADAVVVAWCRKRRLPPLTFDRELEKAARA